VHPRELLCAQEGLLDVTGEEGHVSEDFDLDTLLLEEAAILSHLGEAVLDQSHEGVHLDLAAF
jgi:hypothetical protein